MGSIPSFVPRLVALTVVWLLATTALTYAASRRLADGPLPAVAPIATSSSTTTTQTTELVVPDVRKQAYVFAEGTLGDAGFGWKVAAGAKGFPSNTVVSQSPAPGVHVIDTGAPTIVLHLAKNGKQAGDAEQTSSRPGTALKLADLATAAVAPAAKTKPVVKKPAVKKRAVKTTVVKTPKKKAPSKRPPAFAVAGARREPLDEMPLTARASKLLTWVAKHPDPSDPNVKYWLYQHAWIVTGARMGWWHGAEALETLLAVDRKVEGEWGVGTKSAVVAQQALTFAGTQAK
jgi:hypothetical protein